MIGMVLVTHGKLAEEFRLATEHVVGKQQNFSAICIFPDDDMEMRRSEISKAVAAVNTGAGTVIFTDMFGGTPSNLSISVMSGSDIEVVAGINLPMLIKFASVRMDMSIKDACIAAQEAGRKYINVASNLLSPKKAS